MLKEKDLKKVSSLFIEREREINDKINDIYIDIDFGSFEF